MSGLVRCIQCGYDLTAEHARLIMAANAAETEKARRELLDHAARLRPLIALGFCRVHAPSITANNRRPARDGAIKVLACEYIRAADTVRVLSQLGMIPPARANGGRLSPEVVRVQRLAEELEAYLGPRTPAGNPARYIDPDSTRKDTE